MSAAPASNSPDNQIFARWRRLDGACFLLCAGPRPDSDEVHTHEQVRVSFILKGAIAEIDDRGLRVERGALTMQATPASAPHSHLFLTEHLSTICFDIGPEILSNLGEGARVFDEPRTLGKAAIGPLIPRFQKEILRNDASSDLILKGLVYELAGDLVRRTQASRTGEPPFWLLRARELLHDAWQQNLGVEEIARAVGVHPSHLVRMFRAQFGTSPGEYLREVRLEHATTQVLRSDRPLKEIAAEAGFADPSHFTRTFKKRHGMSPEQYRKSER